MVKGILSLLVFIILCGSVLAVGSILEVDGGGTVERSGSVMDAKEGMSLQCSDVIKGDAEDTLIRLKVHDEIIKIEGTDDWELYCGNKLGGKIKYLKGSGYITRGTSKLPARDEMNLLVGDIVSTEDEARISIELNNGETLKLQGKNSIKIPATEEKPGILDHIKNAAVKVKNWFSNLLKGECFEIKAPADGPGSRG